MSNRGSVSQLIDRVKAGESTAIAALWNRYHQALQRQARQRLDGTPHRMVDEDDLTSIIFQSFFRRAGAGQFPDLTNRREFWALLMTITDRKVVNNFRRMMTDKRGGGRVASDPGWASLADGPDVGVLATLESMEPPPELVAAAAELLAQLDDEMRRLVLLRQQGHTYQEIAQRVNRSVATVERRLRLLREECEEELLR